MLLPNKIISILCLRLIDVGDLRELTVLLFTAGVLLPGLGEVLFALVGLVLPVSFVQLVLEDLSDDDE